MSKKSDKEMIKALHENSENMTDWEIQFLDDVTLWEGDLTPKQAKALERIYAERLGVDELFDEEESDA